MPESPANVNETSALADDVREAVANANFKVTAEAPTVMQNLALQNFIAHQQRLNQIAESELVSAQALNRAILGRVVNSLLDTEPTDALAAQKVFSGNDVAQQITSLLAALASGQQGAKVAQTTPPPTTGT